MDPLALYPEGFAARRQDMDPGRCQEDPFRQACSGINDMFAVIE